MATRILGISTEPESFSAAVVLENRVVSAIEQFKIREHWAPKENALLPREAILAALKAAHVDPFEIDVVAFTAPVQSADRIAASIRRLGLNPRARLEHVDRRLAHAAAAFHSSPFDRAAILILDIASPPETTCVAVGEGAHIELDDSVKGHRTLGSLYGEISRTLGFDRRTFNKVAWLGAVGEPEFLDVLREGIQRNGYDKNHAVIRAIDLQRPYNVAASLQALTNER